jgi:hypothetical protein
MGKKTSEHRSNSPGREGAYREQGTMSIKPDEVVILSLGTAALFFMLSRRERLKTLPYSSLFLSSFVTLLAAWVLTILEDLFLPDIMNVLEHVGYAASTVLLMLWVGSTFVPDRMGRK